MHLSWIPKEFLLPKGKHSFLTYLFVLHDTHLGGLPTAGT